MVKSLADGFHRAIYVGLLTCSLACAQEVATSMSYSWDQPSGDFYAYAQSTLDYASSYYYYACVYIDFGSPRQIPSRIARHHVMMRTLR
jgi:hypothetical protein